MQNPSTQKPGGQNKKTATHQVEIDILLLLCFRLIWLQSRVLSSRVNECCVPQDKNSAVILFPVPET